MDKNRPVTEGWRIRKISEISLALLLAGGPTAALAQEPTPPLKIESSQKPAGEVKAIQFAPSGQPVPGQTFQVQPLPPGQVPAQGDFVVQPPANSTQPPTVISGQATPKAAEPAKKAFVTKSAPADLSSRPSKRKSSPANELQFSFKDADWEDVLTWFADETGRTLLMDTKPTGKFNYHDSNKYTVSEALDVINNVLLSKGFILVRRDNFLQVVELKDGIPPHLVQRVKLEDLPKYGRTELVRVLIPLVGMVAEKVKEEVDQLKGPFGTINALASVNQLQVVDIAKNVEQIYDLIKNVGDEKADLRSFHLNYVSVLEVEKNVREILGMGPRDTPAAQPGGQQNQPGGGGFRNRFGGGGGGDPRARMQEMMAQGMAMMNGGQPGGPGGPGGNPMAAMMGGQPKSATGPFVAADERTNTLFVASTPDNLSKVAIVVKQLDVQQANSPDMEAQTPRFQVYPVSAGMADGLSKVLDQMFNRTGDTKINAHPDGKALIVYAVPREHTRISAILEQLKTESVKTEVIQLTKLEAASTAALIKSLLGEKKEDDSARRMPFFFRFGQQQQENEPNFGPTVEADTGENRLVIRGTELQRSEIRDLLAKLGEPNIPGANGGIENGKYRVMQLKGRDAADVARDFQRIWKQLETKNAIQVEVLDDKPTAAPKMERETRPQRKGDDEGEPKSKRGRPSRSSGDAKNDQSSAIKPGRIENILTVGWTRPADEGNTTEAIELVSDDEVVKSASKDDGSLKQPRTLKPDALKGLDKKPEEIKPKPVTVVFGPDNVTLASDDPKALELADRILRSLTDQKGSKKNSGFALFYLRSADAQDMAYMIDEALYGQKSPFAIGDNNPQQARIIPDTRTNALLVVGPPGEQRKVEMLLEKLDSEDAPESDIQPKPKPIQLQYASASDIAKEIKEVYADRMVDGGGGGGGGGGFGGGGMAFMFGGGGGGNRRRTGRGKIAVSYDDTTNTILVAAPKDLFEEIESFAKDLDGKAKGNQRVARIVRLKNADPEAVAAALGNLLGVKTTAKNKPANGQQNQNGNPNDPNNPNGQGGMFGGNNGGNGFQGGNGFRGGGGGGGGGGPGGGGGGRRRFGGGGN